MPRIINIFFVSILAMVVSFSAQADTPLNAHQTGNIPFDVSLANTPNGQTIHNIDNAASDTHADHAAEHGTHEKKSGLPQFDVTTFSSQLFWLFITFSILYVFFAKKALPALSSTIDTRKTTIRNDIDAANKLSADVDAIKAEYEEEMAKAHNEARLTRLSVENSMREKAEAEAHLFKEKSMSAISDLEQKAEIAKQKIQEELLGVASQVTKDIVEKLSPLNLSENDIQTAVNTYIEKETASTSQKKAA